MDNATGKTLPNESTEVFLTDGGLETTLIFLEGFELPCFASFDLLKSDEGRRALTAYYSRYLSIAREKGFGFVLETPTWRANPDWVEKCGYDRSETAVINVEAAKLLADLRTDLAAASSSSVIVSGCIGPRGDGYAADTAMSAEEARDYHSEQIGALAGVPVDVVSAITMTNVEEAIGIADAAADAGLPSVISFTVETDGRLPSGVTLGEAIETVDRSAKIPPAYYMINCAHPTHFADDLLAAKDQPWTDRIRGLRANASTKSHAELDESTELDRGDLAEFQSGHEKLVKQFPKMNVFGGCCGTDEEHIAAIAKVLKVH